MYITSLGIFKNAIEYHQLQPTICKETGEKAVELNACGNLGAAHCQLRDFKRAIKYHQQHLSIDKYIKDQTAKEYSNLGLTYYSFNDVRKAEEFTSH